MKRHRHLVHTLGALAPLLAVLAGCGGEAAEAPAPVAPAPSATASAPVSSSTPTPTGSPTPDPAAEQAFVDSFRAKTTAGTYTPPKGVAKDAAAAKKYITALTDERLVLTGKYACSAAQQDVTKSTFISTLLANSGTEKGIKQLLPLVWDESTNLLCPKV